MNKGQVQIHETIIVVFIIFMMLILGLIFYYQFELRSIENIKKENDEDTFYFMLVFIPSMPELRCSSFGIENECIVITKAKAFENLREEYYKSIFGSKKINLVVDNNL